MEAGVLVDHLLEAATARRASDIHIQPLEEKGLIQLRIDGVLSEWMTCSNSQLRAVISKLKYIAHMDIGEKRLPQDGALLQTLKNEKVQLRLSTMPTVCGEKMVVRLFPQQQENLTLSHLGFTSLQYRLLRNMIKLPHGLLLITGPTGSGKTTTMYKILEELTNEKGKNICSLEDPVEIRLPSLTQVQVQPQQGMTFAKGLRALLRQDPDVIFVGEIRDEETAEIAVRAALTGHFVMSTLHTPQTIGAIARLLEMGVKPYYVASALTGVITQRLFRKCCPYCRNGCYACFNTSYLGRQAIYEMLPVGPALKKEIKSGTDEERLRHATEKLCLPSLQDLLLRHVGMGLTTEQEYFRLITP